MRRRKIHPETNQGQKTEVTIIHDESDALNMGHTRNKDQIKGIQMNTLHSSLVFNYGW